MHYVFHSSLLWEIRWRWKKGILYQCNMLGVMQASDACCDFFPSKNVLNVFTVMDIGALWIKVGNEVDSPLAMKEFHVESRKLTYFCSAKAEFECTVHKRLAQQKETQAELKTVKTCNITTKAMWLSK